MMSWPAFASLSAVRTATRDEMSTYLATLQWQHRRKLPKVDSYFVLKWELILLLEKVVIFIYFFYSYVIDLLLMSCLV